MTKKAFISIVLLLTYSLGFAHNFIPHSHSIDEENHAITHEEDGHHHHHNHSTKHLTSDHEHISHGSHYDETLYDLLVCFMHDTHNHENDCEDHYFLAVNSTRNIITKIQANKLVTALFTIISETQQNEFITDYFPNLEIAYLSPPKGESPLRGPPKNS